MTTVLITGANRGIGLGLVEQYLDKGAAVIATARQVKSADALSKLQSRGNLKILPLDVGSSDSIEQLAASLEGQCVDIVINNAGIGGGHSQSLHDIDVDSWLQVLHINTLSPLLLTRALLPNLKLSNNPKVMMMSSQLGAISYPNIGRYAYESSKAALNKVVKGMAEDLRQDHICVSALHPGWVKTDMGGPDAAITVETAAAGLVNTIEGLDMSETGSFWQWNGSRHDW